MVSGEVWTNSLQIMKQSWNIWPPSFPELQETILCKFYFCLWNYEPYKNLNGTVVRKHSYFYVGAIIFLKSTWNWSNLTSNGNRLKKKCKSVYWHRFSRQNLWTFGPKWVILQDFSKFRRKKIFPKCKISAGLVLKRGFYFFIA